MSSHIQSYVHFRSLHKSIKFFLQTNRESDSIIRDMIIRGPNPPDDLDLFTTEDLAWYIVHQVVIAQVACVNAQYVHHLDDDTNLERLIFDEVAGIMNDAKAVKGAPFIEGAPVHVMLRSTMYQCEPEHLDKHVSHELAEQAKFGIELIEHLDYAVMDTFIRKHLVKDTVAYWGFDETDLEEADNEPTLLIGGK